MVSRVGASAVLARDKCTDLGAVTRKVSVMGYRLTAFGTGDDMGQRIVAEMRRVSIRLAVAVASGMWIMMLSILLYLNPDNIAAGAAGRALAMAAGAMTLLLAAWAGAPILMAGWRTARVGVTGAVVAPVSSLAVGRSEVWFGKAVMLVTLPTLGRLIEMGTLRQFSHAITDLGEALPETARLIWGGRDCPRNPCSRYFHRSAYPHRRGRAGAAGW